MVTIPHEGRLNELKVYILLISPMLCLTKPIWLKADYQHRCRSQVKALPFHAENAGLIPRMGAFVELIPGGTRSSYRSNIVEKAFQSIFTHSLCKQDQNFKRACMTKI